VNTNLLYHGGGLAVLCKRVRDECVDLVYLDRPFNSNAIYNVLFEKYGGWSAARTLAFRDTRERNEASAATYQADVVSASEDSPESGTSSQRTALQSGVLLSGTPAGGGDGHDRTE
jgi:site-specific DNA-methyltransferase (adenine-specific)